MGGGGFTMEPEASVLDDYVLSLAPAREPRICLLPTAGGDSEEQIRRFRIAFGDRLCETSVLSLFRLGRQPVSLRDHLLARTSSTSGAARWSTCSRSGARTGSTRSCARRGRPGSCWPG
jgi:hypothetical protein